MYMSASDYELKSHLKFPIIMLYKCASNRISRDNETLLLVAAISTPISSFWEGPLQNSVPLSNFPTHSYQIISSF